MNYRESLSYLSRLGDEVRTVKIGLNNIRTLLEALGNPHCKYPSVLVAGTNGKGSVSTFLSSILTASGRKTGLYTSPHLVKVEERIALNGRAIGPAAFADCLSDVVAAIRSVTLPSHPTFFETVTAAAFLYFAKEKADFVVLEVGMGGRFDSTNIAQPLMSVITPIGMDHQQYLGETLEEIAYQKAGIIRQHGVALSAPQRTGARLALEAEAYARQATLHTLDEQELVVQSSDRGLYRFRFHGLDYQLGLYGRHQISNAGLALQAAEILRTKGFLVDDAAMAVGVNSARIAGRLQKIQDDPATFLDGAHNAEAVDTLLGFVREHTEPPRSLVFGMMRDKDIAAAAALVADDFDSVFLTQVSSARAATTAELSRYLPAGIEVPDPVAAFWRARRKVRTTVVSGSLYLVGEILARCGGGVTPAKGQPS
jgi:dihydrofolate synthase/folylpolyglutamate synthase